MGRLTEQEADAAAEYVEGDRRVRTEITMQRSIVAGHPRWCLAHTEGRVCGHQGDFRHVSAWQPVPLDGRTDEQIRVRRVRLDEFTFGYLAVGEEEIEMNVRNLSIKGHPGRVDLNRNDWNEMVHVVGRLFTLEAEDFIPDGSPDLDADFAPRRRVLEPAEEI